MNAARCVQWLADEAASADYLATRYDAQGWLEDAAQWRERAEMLRQCEQVLRRQRDALAAAADWHSGEIA